MSQQRNGREKPVSSGQFSTQTGPFSTQAVARIQLRDLNFVSHASTSGYITTGVESRSSVAFAPTIRGAHVALRADRRSSSRPSSSTVSRLS